MNENINTYRQKFKLKQILGETICDILKENGAFVIGGAITSIFTNTPINDFDIYCKTQDKAYELSKKLEDYSTKQYLRYHSRGNMFLCNTKVGETYFRLHLQVMTEFWGDIQDIFDREELSKELKKHISYKGDDYFLFAGGLYNADNCEQLGTYKIESEQK